METSKLTPQELNKLHTIRDKHMRKFIFMLAFSIIVPLIIGFIPAKYLPKRLSNRGNNTLGDESIASLIGTGNFLLFILIWSALMTWAGLATYRNIGIKKDLKDQRKRAVKGIVTYVGVYEGKHFVRLKKGTGVNILHFDKSNYRPLQVGDTVSFEVYEHSKLLIQILQHQPKVVKKRVAKVINVEDQCPACGYALGKDDTQCLECGLNFS